MARLFRAAADAETVHALNHIRAAGKVGGTAANLGEAIKGESYEFQKMYPEFLAVAKKEKNKQAEWSFDLANKVEAIHAGLYQKALNAVSAGKIPPSVDYYVCQVCGNTVENFPPNECPICGSPKSMFKNMD